MKEIEVRLKTFSRRVRLLRAWRGLAAGLALGAFLGVIFASLDYFGVVYATWLSLSIIFLAGGLLGMLIGILLPVDKSALADSIDRRGELKNRLRTAIEKSDGGGEFDKALLTDAAAHLSTINPRKTFPFRMTRWHGAALVALAIASAIFLLGNSPLLLSAQQKKDREELQGIAKAVERVAKPVLEKNEKQDVSAAERELAERLEKFARDLEKGRMTKQEALINANELTNEADRLAKERFEKADKSLMEAETALSKLEKERLDAAGMKDADLSKAHASKEDLDNEEKALQSEVDKLSKQLKEQGASPEKRAELEAELKKAQDDLNQIQLSKKAKDFLERLYSQPEYKELMKLAREAKQLAAEGKQGQQKLSEEQVREMIKRLEQLADKLKNEEDLKKFIEELKKSLRDCEGG